MAKAKIEDCLLVAVNYIYKQHGIARIDKIAPYYSLIEEILGERLVIEKKLVEKFVSLDDYMNTIPRGLFIIDCCVLYFDANGNIRDNRNNHCVVVHDGRFIDNGYMYTVNKDEVLVKLLVEKSYKIVKKRLDNSQNNNYIRE